MDPLTDMLEGLRLKTGFYCRSDMSAPWGMAYSIEDGPAFHIVLAGHGFLRLDSQRIPLQAGDIALLPHAVAHDLVSEAETPAIPFRELPSVYIGDHTALLNYGGDGERSLLIRGRARLTGPAIHPLLELLPQVMLLHTRDQQERQRADR